MDAALTFLPFNIILFDELEEFNDNGRSITNRFHHSDAIIFRFSSLTSFYNCNLLFNLLSDVAVWGGLSEN